MSDRRVKYTKQALRDSLIHFLKDKPIARITVKEICEYADVNRSTYYAHYKDQLDQLDQVEVDFLAGINAYLDEIVPEIGENQNFAELRGLFEYISDNRDLCLSLLGKNVDFDFENKVMAAVREHVIPNWRALGALEQHLALMTFQFVTSGGIGLLRFYLISDSPALTPAQMAEFVLRLSNYGLNGLVQQSKAGEAPSSAPLNTPAKPKETRS